MADKIAASLRNAASLVLWPFVYFGGLLAAGMAFRSEFPLLWFTAVYLLVAAIIAVFEPLMPYATGWLAHDGEAFNDLAHTLLNKGLVQVAAAIAASFPMLVAIVVQPITGPTAHVWPSWWPIAVQVVLALVIAEFGLYVAHRLAHERLYFWRFHALHHSVTRLWVINTGRFHIVDSLLKLVLSQLPLYLLGAPLPVFLWVGAVTAFTGLLTHCNIVLRTGFLDWIFSTPRLHRWHHSTNISEGNRNYCENIVLWDHLFGTYYNPQRPSSVDIGISGWVRRDFIGQILQPFSKKGVRQILGQESH